MGRTCVKDAHTIFFTPLFGIKCDDIFSKTYVGSMQSVIHYFLLAACAGVGGHAGGIPFEVWCRFYYPNVRDQVIAKVSQDQSIV